MNACELVLGSRDGSTLVSCVVIENTLYCINTGLCERERERECRQPTSSMSSMRALRCFLWYDWMYVRLCVRMYACVYVLCECVCE